jgi:hypothetical protein
MVASSLVARLIVESRHMRWRDKTELATIEGELMGVDKNSSHGRCLVQQDEHGQSKTSPTRTTQVCQSHVAIEVLLNLEANHSTNRNKHSQHTVEICTATDHSTNRNKHSQHTADICTACRLCYTGQTDGLLRSDLVTPGTKNHL